MNIAVVEDSGGYVNYDRGDVRDQIERLIDSDVKIVPIEDNLGVTLEKYIDTKHTIMVHDTYFTRSELYQAMFIEGTHLEVKGNNLGTQFCNGIKAIGRVVIAKYKIVDLNTCVMTSITESDIKEVLTKKFLKTGVAVSASGDVTEFTYSLHPLEKMTYDDCAYTIRFHEMALFDSILTMYVRIDRYDDLNESASLIWGRKTGGNVMFTLSRMFEDANSIYFMDLTDSIFKKILELSRFKSFTPSLATYDKMRFKFVYRILDEMKIEEGELKTIPEEDYINRYV